MKFLVFDVETTGLPKGRPSVFVTHKWPYIIQMSWFVYNTTNNKIGTIQNHIIRLPKGLGICEESTKIHGITTEHMLENGVDINPILNQFMNDVKKCRIIIAHNINFDKNMIMVEQVRHNHRNLLYKIRKKEYCTMKNGRLTTGIKIYNKYKKCYVYKYPKLIELHCKLFNDTPNNLHDSLIDILVCFRCFGKLYWGVDILNINYKLSNLWSRLITN